MGRQIPVIMGARDEALFIQRVSAEGSVQILESFAADPDSLRVESFASEHRGHCNYRLWPTRFPWTPEYSRATTGDWYVSNGHVAPVLEYSRPPLSRDRPGRLYWSKDFSGTPDYDVQAFGKWVDAIFGWVRKTATKRSFGGMNGVWVFPDALSALQLERPHEEW